MALRCDGQTIVDVRLDYALVLRTDDGIEIRVETDYALRGPGGTTTVDVLAGRTVQRAVVDGSGALLLSFGSGVTLRAGPDDAYEAWTIAGPRGWKVVCMPGGEIASWQPEDG